MVVHNCTTYTSYHNLIKSPFWGSVGSNTIRSSMIGHFGFRVRVSEMMIEKFNVRSQCSVNISEHHISFSLEQLLQWEAEKLQNSLQLFCKKIEIFGLVFLEINLTGWTYFRKKKLSSKKKFIFLIQNLPKHCHIKMQ